MARWQQWPVVDGAYKDDALPWSAQDTVNWLPTPAEQAGARSPVILRTPPGLVEFCDLGTDAPLRGTHNVEGLLLAVSDNTLFRVSTAGVATAIGTIPGVGRVSMDHTPRGAGFHVGIANGQSGYIYDTATDTLTQITDEGFPGATIFQFIDGYLAFLEPFGKFWGHSELNDGLNYNTLDRYTAESAPDGIRSLIVSHREVFIPGDRSGEFFRNTGAATGTFARADGYEMERGIASAYAITRIDNTLAWWGDDGIAYKLEGHQPVRISNGAIETAVADLNPANVFAFTWEDRGHKVAYFTFPDGQTWGWDAWTGKWHRRQSYGLNRWRLATLTRWADQWIGGDYTNGKLYTLSWADDAVHENGAPLVSERTFPVAHDVGNDLIVNGIALFFDTGRASITRPRIVGDVPDGIVGEGVTGAYTVSGGIPPYSDAAILSGTFPPGLTLNPDYTYSGMFTTGGSYSWTVGGTDAFGQPFSTPDTAEVTANVDPFWDDVVSLWRPTGALGSTLVDDEKPVFWGSPDASQKPIIVSEPDSFSLTALEFDATDIGDIIYTVESEGSIVQAEPFGMGTGKFTYEGMVEFNSVSGTQTLVQLSQATPSLALQISGGQWRVYSVSAGATVLGPVSAAPDAGVPTFWQLRRTDAGELELSVEGTVLGSVAHTFDYSGAQATYYGRQQNTANELDGRLWMCRITKGHARTNAIPTLPFPNVGP